MDQVVVFGLGSKHLNPVMLHYSSLTPLYNPQNKAREVILFTVMSISWYFRSIKMIPKAAHIYYSLGFCELLVSSFGQVWLGWSGCSGVALLM